MKILTALTLTSLLLLPLMAVNAAETPDKTAPEIVTTGAGLVALIGIIGNWVFTFLMAVAVIMLIIAGFFWVTAGGSPENVNKARQMLINALIGVTVALLAKGVVAALKSILGAT